MITFCKLIIYFIEESTFILYMSVFEIDKLQSQKSQTGTQVQISDWEFSLETPTHPGKSS